MEKLGSGIAQTKELAGDSVDRPVLKALREDIESDPDLFAKLIGTFLNEVSKRMNALQHAVEQANAEAMMDAAHGLKGMSSTFGARRMASLCLELEKKGRAGSVCDTGAIFSELETESGYVRQLFELELMADR
jgi:HPt (histidine-containing phosphotransfer) domain-containing protein